MSPQMPQILAPNVRVPVQPLDPLAFAGFGTVIQNPEYSPAAGSIQHNVVAANQGSALKYIDVSLLTNHYDLSPSKKPAKPIMTMFVCSPRRLDKATSQASNSIKSSSTNSSTTSESTLGENAALFPVHILERHPYTPQTFIPTGLARDDTTTKYLVIVAPTLPMSSGKGSSKTSSSPSQTSKRRRSIGEVFSKARSSSSTNVKSLSSFSSSSSTDAGPQKPKGPGKPDLTQVKAFLADGSQSVTYGPGTWHAPMVVLGAKSIDFVVVQYANGVALEDCQEIALVHDKNAEGVKVLVDDSTLNRTLVERAKL